MDDKLLRGAVDRVRNFRDRYMELAEKDNGDINVTALNRLVDLAERYLQASEVMPEMKNPNDTDGASIDMYEGFNQALDACTLALTKKLEGLEGILEGVSGCGLKEASDAIRKHILGEKI